MTNAKDTILELVKHSKANADLASVLYKVIEAAPKQEQVELFKTATLVFKYVPSDSDWELKKVFEPSEEATMFENAKNELSKVLYDLRKANLSEDDFNKKLWESISDKEIFKDEKERYMMMFACCANKKLPYVDISKTLKMDAKEFDAAIAEVNPVLLSAVKHVLSLNNGQFTQDASLLVPLLDSCKDQMEKTMLLAAAFARFRGKILASLPINPFEDDDE